MSNKPTPGTKQAKHLKFIVFLIGLTTVCSVVFVAIYVYGLHHPLVQKLVPVTATQVPLDASEVSINYALPARLQIPKLQIDAPVVYIGLTDNGDMGAPTNVVDAGWYKYGALPGNTGTAVIAGHLDGIHGEPGVFNNLNKLAIGDSIIVIESNGLSVSFVVREIKSYPQNAQPSEVFSSASGSHLNLITCTGSWNSSEHLYAQRLVVFADKAS